MTAAVSAQTARPRMGAGPRAACIYLAIVALAAIFAGVVSPRDPLTINPNNILASPGFRDLLGTDELGRDLLARIIYGGRVSLEVAVSAVVLACAIGIPLGIGIAFCGRRVETVAMRIIDVFVSLPGDLRRHRDPRLRRRRARHAHRHDRIAVLPALRPRGLRHDEKHPCRANMC